MKQKLTLLIVSLLLFSPIFAQKKRAKQKESKSNEELFFETNFKLITPSKWAPGERFIYVNEKLNITLRAEDPSSGVPEDFSNQLFIFESFKEQTDWMGNSTLNLCFKNREKNYLFETGRSLQQFSDTTYNPLIPGLIWLREIELADSILKNKQLYILTNEWFTTIPHEAVSTYRYAPVTITKVVPGNEHIPVRIYFKDNKENEFSLLTSLSGTLNSSSRVSFDKVFSFSDPRPTYKEARDEFWEAITYGKVEKGMNHYEVRLAVGRPSDINRIPTYSGLKEQWSYNNGMMIYFEDGLVTNLRR